MKRKIKFGTEEDIRKELMNYSVEDLINLLVQYVQEENVSKQIPITQEQFDQHFRIVQKRGRKADKWCYLRLLFYLIRYRVDY